MELASDVPAPPNRPDVVQSALSHPPATAAPGGHFPVTDTVMNQGTTRAPGSSAAYYLSPEPGKTAESIAIGRHPVPPLAPGGSSQRTMAVTVSRTFVPGTYSLIACADNLRGGQVVEADETNNCKASAGTVTVPRPTPTEAHL